MIEKKRRFPISPSDWLSAAHLNKHNLIKNN